MKFHFKFLNFLLHKANETSLNFYLCTMKSMGKTVFTRTISAAMSQLRTSSEIFKEKCGKLGSPFYCVIVVFPSGHVGNEAELSQHKWGKIHLWSFGVRAQNCVGGFVGDLRELLSAKTLFC